MNGLKKSFLTIAVILLFLSSCKKYEEGPLVSLQSREKRVANVWKVQRAFDLNGKDVTANYDLKKWELTDQFSVIYHEDQKKYFGRWQFTQNNENLEISYDSLPEQTYIIKELKDKELTLTRRDNDITIEFIPVNN